MEGEEFFDIQRKCLHFTGFRLHKKYNMLLRLLQFYHILSAAYCWFSEGLFIFKESNGILETAEVFGPLATAFMSMSKEITLFVSLEKFYAIMDRLKVLGLEGELDNVRLCFVTYNLESSLIVEKSGAPLIKEANRWSRRVALAYLLACGLTGISYIVNPLISNILNYFIYQGEANHNMPFKTAFFYDISKSPAYELTFLNFSGAIVTVILNSVS